MRPRGDRGSVALCVLLVTLPCFSRSPRTESHCSTPAETMVPLPSQSPSANTSNLGDDIVSEFCVLDHSMGQTRRKESDVSLNLMQHSIHIGQLHLVLHAGGLVASNHAIKFFVNFGCRDKRGLLRLIFPGDLEILARSDRK